MQPYNMVFFNTINWMHTYALTMAHISLHLIHLTSSNTFTSPTNIISHIFHSNHSNSTNQSWYPTILHLPNNSVLSVSLRSARNRQFSLNQQLPLQISRTHQWLQQIKPFLS